MPAQNPSAARNAAGRVFLFADKVTPSMARAMDETARRRAKQMAYNEAHGITPKTIIKPINNGLLAMLGGSKAAADAEGKIAKDLFDLEVFKALPKKKQETLLSQIESEMKAAAKLLDFDKATELRDALFALQRV
jgi:excinuclease ABC subunit B